MKTSLLQSILIGSLCALISLPVLAQEDELKNLAGFVDFGDLSETYGEPSISINIGGTLLGFVSAMSEDSNPDTAEMMGQLKGVRVFGYPISEDPGVAKSKFAEVRSNLRSKGWEPVVQVNDADDQVLIFMKMDGANMEGLTVMTVDPTEVMFINIIGRLDPNKLGQMMKTFDVDIDGALDFEDDEDSE
jgi:hypothetical protein